MPCIPMEMIGGQFLQGVVNLPSTALQSIGQISQRVTMLQSFNALQVLNCSRCQNLFSSAQAALTQFSSLGLGGPLLTKAKNILTGLQSVSGFQDGLFGFLKQPNLTALLTLEGQTFIASMHDLLGTNYAANINGLSYLSEVFKFLGYSTSNSSGVDLVSDLPSPPTVKGNLNNFGFLSPILLQHGDNLGLEEILKSSDRLLLELKGQAMLFHSGNLSSSNDLADFNLLVREMHEAGLLLDPTVTGLEAIYSMTNMLELLSMFDR